MRMKSYFADTVEEAISLARREMGPDAMLVNSKRSGVEAKHLGACEVVCASETDLQRREIRQSASPQPMDKLALDVSNLKHQIERLSLTLARSGPGMAGFASEPERTKVFSELSEAELDLEIAHNIIGKLESPASREALRAELRKIIRVDRQLGCPDFPVKRVALVGPPGAGKTTTLVKLAVEYGITSRKPAQILSLDTFRIAASDELRSYATILGIGFQLLETTAALAQALEEHHSKDLILIDTPGLARDELDGFRDLAEFLATWPGIDTHLVLPASMRARDLERIAGLYQIFKPAKLLFTRLDETETFGPILNLSVKTKLPVSFLCGGQRIPEDLEGASEESLLDLVLKRFPAAQTVFQSAAA